MCEVPVGANSQTQVAAECIGVAVVTGWALARLEAVYVGELTEELSLSGVGLVLLTGIAFVFKWGSTMYSIEGHRRGERLPRQHHTPLQRGQTHCRSYGGA